MFITKNSTYYSKLGMYRAHGNQGCVCYNVILIYINYLGLGLEARGEEESGCRKRHNEVDDDGKR